MLVVPIALILIFKTGTTQLVKLPVYGDKVFVNGDSVDYSINLNKIIDDNPILHDKHILLYFSENVKNSLRDDAKENISIIAQRVHNAIDHPRNPVKDVVFVSIVDSILENDTLKSYIRTKAKSDIDSYVADELKNSFGFSETPVKDHVLFLIDKDKRVRSMYFSSHGKFDRNILGELVVLRTEYGNNTAN
ncbi:MAG: hypothetical protein ACPGLV_06340 [Bacteroidia bacterium]